MLPTDPTLLINILAPHGATMDPATIFARNLAALVKADGRSQTKVALACFPDAKDSHAATRDLKRALGKAPGQDGPGWPTARVVTAVCQGLGLESLEPLFSS